MYNRPFYSYIDFDTINYRTEIVPKCSVLGFRLYFKGLFVVELAYLVCLGLCGIIYEGFKVDLCV